jgi:hypothetical protein
MEKGSTVNEKNPKLVGAMKHLLNELQKVNVINDGDREHLVREYVRGHILGFGHLAEYLAATSNLGNHNYQEVVEYGRRYGEVR